MKKVLAVTGFLLLIWSSCLIAAEVAYEFKTVDIPGYQIIEDIDDDGTVLVNNQYTILTLDPNPRRGKNRNISFTCGQETFGASLSNGVIVGFCPDGAFVRQKDGTVIMLSALGDDAAAWGVAKDGTVGGQYFTSNGPPNYGGTAHGFTWHPDRGYKTIDYIDGRPGSRTYSVVIAPISNGRVLGEYSVYENFTNNDLEHGYWIYDNGIFDTTSLPRGYQVEISDMNDLGQVIIKRNTLSPSLELFDDGIIYQITGWPVGWILQLLSGSNNEGQFTGYYMQQTGIDPYYGWPTYTHHSFVATPAPIKRHERIIQANK